MNPVKIGICGLGTVGSGTFNVMTRNSESINARAGCEISIVQVGARRDNPNCDLGNILVTRDIFEVANNPEIDIVVELVGGTTVARELVMTAIENGKHVVTANKALIAEYEIFALAKEKGERLLLKLQLLAAYRLSKPFGRGWQPTRLSGWPHIINGTGNFILTEMRDKARAFEDVLKEAQELGYAEADPTFDVEGIDAAHKLVILASLAFGIPLQFEKFLPEAKSHHRRMSLTLEWLVTALQFRHCPSQFKWQRWYRAESSPYADP
ncbi:MAG: homoserine dehydrogenase [Porticoccaceae bacterium]